MFGSISDLITAVQGSLGDATTTSTDLSGVIFGSLQGVVDDNA